MRDLLLLGFIFGGLLLTVRYPFAGLLLWAWFTLAIPHQATYNQGYLPLNMIITGVTFLSFFFHREYEKFRFSGLLGLVLLFALWLWVAQTQSLDPSSSSEFFVRYMKILLFIVLCMLAITNRLRFHALLWIFVIAIGYYGAKGGAYTILTGGKNIYFGPIDSVLYDNNHMGIAMAATLPLFLYMHGQVAHSLTRHVLKLVFVLTVIAILGTHSRGALVSLVIFALFFWMRSNKKLLLLGAAAIIIVPALSILPSKWFERMETIDNATEDESFMSRVDAWWINYKLAKEHPLTGAGLRNSYNLDIARQVELYRTPRAAHSIYFEILGGAGFVGLSIFLSLLGVAYLTAMKAYRKYRYAKNDRWRSDFAYHAQTFLAVFAVGGASVSMEMWEGFLLIIALISVLKRLDNPIEENIGSKVQLKNLTKTDAAPV